MQIQAEFCDVLFKVWCRSQPGLFGNRGESSSSQQLDVYVQCSAGGFSDKAGVVDVQERGQ